MTPDENDSLTTVVTREKSGLRRFIQRRVADPADVEDILQEVFAELVEANRLLMPIEHVAGWLYRVARNRIIDAFRKKRPLPFSDIGGADADDDTSLRFEDLLPAPDDGPEAIWWRGALIEELESALDALPPDQRAVFVAHEIEGRSFKELAETEGVSINTLLSRKRYAVLRLRERLRPVFDDFQQMYPQLRRN